MMLVVDVDVFVVVLMRSARMITSIVVGNVDDGCYYVCSVAGDDCYGDYCSLGPSFLLSLYYLI